MFVTAYFVYIGWYPQAVFSFMFFLAMQTNLLIYFIIHPAPRYIVGAVITDKDGKKTVLKDPDVSVEKE